MKTKTSLHEQQLNDLIERVQILDEKTYLVDGEKNVVLHQQPHTIHLSPLSEFGTNNSQNKEQLRSQLIQHLGNTLYSSFYCGIPKENKKFNLPPKKEREAFMNELSNSNRSTLEPDRNWKIYAVDSQGNAFALKNGDLRAVLPGTYVVNPEQKTFAVNQTIDFLRYRENKAAQSVFYYVYGNTYLAPDCDLIRVYWSIKPEGAALLIDNLTRVLNDYKIPFNFICLNHPDLYNRNDSAVLYFDKHHLSIVKRLLKHIIDAVRPYLIDNHPLFTDIIDTGVSMAEDPGNGESFGMNRVTAIANALVGSHEEKIEGENERKEWIKKCLKEKGISYSAMSVNFHSNRIN